MYDNEEYDEYDMDDYEYQQEIYDVDFEEILSSTDDGVEN